jgi:hypothetical protein
MDLVAVLRDHAARFSGLPAPIPCGRAGPTFP